MTPMVWGFVAEPKVAGGIGKEVQASKVEHPSRAKVEMRHSSPVKAIMNSRILKWMWPPEVSSSVLLVKEAI